jgi:hypothetical protein
MQAVAKPLDVGSAMKWMLVRVCLGLQDRREYGVGPEGHETSS